MDTKKILNVSSNPHVRSGVSTSNIMLAVIIALLPATGFGIYNFGAKVLILILSTIAACVLTEYLFEVIVHKKVTVDDYSAIVTGLLLSLCLPPEAPWWIGVIGGVFAILVVKQLFGGLGQNFMNPALGARCFLLLSFAGIMTNYSSEFFDKGGADAISSATPLQVIRDGGNVNLLDMIIGNTKGTIGETSLIALIIGAIFLIVLGIINLRIPGMYILSFFIIMWLCGGHGFDIQYLCAQLAGGGLILGAFFMATDYVTRPITKKGQYVYGIVLGVLTALFRIYGASAESVSFAIIIGNLLVPIIEKFTQPKAFGRGGEHS